MLKYIISTIILLAPYVGSAQDSLAVKQDTPVVEQDSPVVEEDSLMVRQSKMAINLYVDIGKLGESLFENQIKREFGISILLSNKYQLVGEYGYGSLNPKSVINNGGYTSEGNYYRVGIEYVFTILPKTSLSTGIMYAHSDFADYGNVKIESELWDNLNETFERTELKADWVEWIVNTESPIVKAEEGFLSNFYWGVRLRLRILISDISQPNFDIYAIPGFGKTYSTVLPAANLYLKYRIEF
jgi:hypothetical protein